MNVIENVIRGVAVLGIREPNDALAEWSAVQYQAGSRSAKLYKGGSGNNGSTHLQITPPAGITMQIFSDGVTNNAFYHYCSAVTGNFGQMEFRFEDPNSEAWAEITLVPIQNYPGTAAWVLQTMAADTPTGYGGVTEIGSTFFEWGLIDANLVLAAITALDSGACAPEDWTLARVRIELWEATPERTMYVDTVTINSVTYTIEPGGTAPAMSLSSPFTDIGYTLDGVDIEYTVETSDSEVAEESFAINRNIIKETCVVRCTMKETTLEHLKNAMAGAVLSGNILTLGGGVMKTLNLRIVATNPAGYRTEIFIPKATAIGAVAVSFKKDEDTMVPVEFSALKATNSEAVTIVYNAI